MELKINGKPFQVEENSHIDQLLKQLELNPHQVIIELNRNILKKETFADTRLSQGDTLEIIQFVGGG